MERIATRYGGREGPIQKRIYTARPGRREATGPGFRVYGLGSVEWERVTNSERIKFHYLI